MLISKSFLSFIFSFSYSCFENDFLAGAGAEDDGFLPARSIPDKFIIGISIKRVVIVAAIRVKNASEKNILIKFSQS